MSRNGSLEDRTCTLQAPLPTTISGYQLPFPHVWLLWSSHESQRHPHVPEHYGARLWQLSIMGLFYIAHPAQGARQAAGKSPSFGDCLLHCKSFEDSEKHAFIIL